MGLTSFVFVQAAHRRLIAKDMFSQIVVIKEMALSIDLDPFGELTVVFTFTLYSEH